MIESSDRDGGSAVAVLTYVQSILDTLDHRDLIDLILSYLMALPPDKPKPTRGPLSPSVARRRKSLDLLTEFTKQTETPDLYNLVDLVLTNMESKSQQTVSATLRLVSTILRKHHPYSISTLLKVKPVDLDRPLRTIGAHNKEISYLFNLINEIGGDDETTEASYEACLKDNLILLESHACTAIALEVGDPEHIRPIQARPTSTAGNRALYTHTLRHDDPLLRSIVRLLSTFFSNTVETNLILTCVIVDLASCCYMKLEGWLLPDPSDYEYDDESEDETEEEWAMALEEESDDPFVELERKQIRDLKRARKEPSWRNAPPILEVLHDLSSQVNAYREEVCFPLHREGSDNRLTNWVLLRFST